MGAASSSLRYRLHPSQPRPLACCRLAHSLSLCYFLFLLLSYSATLWPIVTDRDSFKELCDRLAFLDLILSPSGQTFLLLSSQNSVLYFRDLLQHLWGLRKLDLCLQPAALFATRAGSPVVFAQAPTDWSWLPLTGFGRSTSAQAIAHSVWVSSCATAYLVCLPRLGLTPQKPE